MTKSQGALLYLLENHAPDDKKIVSELSPLNLSELYVCLGFLQAFIKFVSEQHWLAKPSSESSFANFISPFLSLELSPLTFLHQLLRSSSPSELNLFFKKASALEEVVIKEAQSRKENERILFATGSLNQMSEIFEHEHTLQKNYKLNGLYLGLSLYRSFDSLDEFFNIDYKKDVGMKADLKNHERLYEGAGVGVQSGYSTALLALKYLNPNRGSRLIDLGSGYGRIGLAVGLLRPDIDFLGYEYVPHRVLNSNACAQNLNLESHVSFLVQDLADKNFIIPEADCFYLYDPFSKETYEHVLKQIVAMSKKRKLSIATKGNARPWLLKIAADENWEMPIEIDNGNLCIFTSNVIIS